MGIALSLFLSEKKPLHFWAFPFATQTIWAAFPSPNTGLVRCSNGGSWTGKAHVRKPRRQPDFWAGSWRRYWAITEQWASSQPRRQVDLFQCSRLQLCWVVPDTPNTWPSPSGPLAREALAEVKDWWPPVERVNLLIFILFNGRDRALLGSHTNSIYTI